ncbi:MAG: HAMP domain-containing histidine kinase [Acidobacteria bacterium]|nr:HAMP domain-containing histidine kinase [Acidobacteriota bacterium]
MSIASQHRLAREQDQAVLGELLHSLSQPLTTLRCSLELSTDEIAGSPQDAVAGALEQTDRVIAVVRLMREYLDAESDDISQSSAPLLPVLREVVEKLSPVAHERQVLLALTGSCDTTLELAEPRLRLALQYLVGRLIEEQPRHGDVTLQLKDSASGAELWAHVRETPITTTVRQDSFRRTLHHVQRVVARRLLESGGASLVFSGDGHSGFLLRVARSAPALESRPAR